ncbi:hypothetical protein H4582DRAFT_1414022 [Lactarius indigo]|nr:hypothetical protein H4582DRAFT_1414022 [Lactarius indigo]
MLSRFSALLVYVIAGLVISAAAVPMGPQPDYYDEPKSRHPGKYYPQSYSPHHKYSKDRPYYKSYDHKYRAYGLDEDKPYPSPEEKKQYPEANQPYPATEEKKYPEEKPYPQPYSEDVKYFEEKPYPQPYSEDKKYPDPSSDKGKDPKSDEYKDHKSDDNKGKDFKSDENKDHKSDDDKAKEVKPEDNKDHNRTITRTTNRTTTRIPNRMTSPAAIPMICSRTLLRLTTLSRVSPGTSLLASASNRVFYFALCVFHVGTILSIRCHSFVHAHMPL